MRLHAAQTTIVAVGVHCSRIPSKSLIFKRLSPIISQGTESTDRSSLLRSAIESRVRNQHVNARSSSLCCSLDCRGQQPMQVPVIERKDWKRIDVFRQRNYSLMGTNCQRMRCLSKSPSFTWWTWLRYSAKLRRMRLQRLDLSVSPPKSCSIS